MQTLASYNRNDFGYEFARIITNICGNLCNSWQKYGARNSPREGWKRKSFFEVLTEKKIAADSLTAAKRSGAGGTPK